MNLRTIEFLAKRGRYNKGDIAAFSDAVCQQIVRDGDAKWFVKPDAAEDPVTAEPKDRQAKPKKKIVMKRESEEVEDFETH